MGEATMVLRVFTHPACSGCGGAVRQAWELGQRRPEIEVRTVSLESNEGLIEARSEGVTTIPTLILARGDRELGRWVGTPRPGDLSAGLEELEAGT